MANDNKGDSNRITREYFDSILIEMRHIDAVLPDTRLNLYGHEFKTPLMTAALSHIRKFGFHENGMPELAKGAAAADAVMWAGMGEDEDEDAELERIAGTGAKTIKILKPVADNDLILRRIAHAEAVGCIAVGMDLDHSFNHRGEYDIVADIPMRPKSLEEIKQFVKATKLPFIIKGVLSVSDADKCVQAGIQGIVVSHHHGIMDYAVPPLMILPKIAEAVKGRFPIFVDCGIESGYDVFKALAMGAAAVCAGRSLMGGLKESGAEGVKAKILDITAQLAGVMARTCSKNIASIDSSLLRF